MNITRQVIKVDPDFAAIWGNLDGEAYQGLKAEIQQDGIRDPLVIWNPSNNYILVDGHNRLRIAEELHMNSVPVVYKVFNSKTEAKSWIFAHQVNRRNATDGQKAIAYGLIRKEYAEEAKTHLGGDRKSDEFQKSSRENSPTLKKEESRTRHRAAQAVGLSDWKARQADYVLKNATEAQKDALRSGAKDLKEVYNETFRATFPTKANRLKQAQEAVEATKQEGATIDLQKAKAHKQAEANLNHELAQETYRAIYDIVSAAGKLTDENLKIYKEYYSQKDMAKLLLNARTVWDAGQKLTNIGLWIQEVKSE